MEHWKVLRNATACTKNGGMTEHDPTHRERILEALSGGRLVHHRDLAGMGVSRMAMSRLVRKGAVVRDGEGYRTPCAPWATTVQ